MYIYICVPTSFIWDELVESVCRRIAGKCGKGPGRTKGKNIHILTSNIDRVIGVNPTYI